MSKIFIILSTSWEILCQLSPWMLLGMILSGMMHVLLPRDFIRRKFQGTTGVLNAVLLGVPLPLCSCGVVPAGIGLKNDGASDGASVGFLISTPQTGIDSILVAAAFFGWPFAIFKMLAAAVTGFVGGVLAGTGSGADESVSTEKPTRPAGEPAIETNILVRAWNHGIEIVRSIWLWLLIGVVVSAVIQILVPHTVFESISGFGLLPAMLLVLLISVPLYVCATASVPIAAVLVASGLSPAVALVFLMAGPATNITTIAAVYGRFGMRTLIVYLSTIIAGSMLFAWVFDRVLQAEVARDTGAHDHDHSGWFSAACAVALLVLIASFAWSDIARQSARRNRQSSSDRPETRINVSGMHCGSCVSRIENGLRQIDGIVSVDVLLKPGLVTLTGDFDSDTVERVVSELGFKVATNSTGNN